MREANFKCRHLRGDGLCKREQKKCNSRKCIHNMECGYCINAEYPPSQEPCENCYFVSKESLLEFIKKET